MRNYDKYDDEPDRSDTEITLGMRSILGIFFGLVLICGVFFGFGYSVGRGNVPKAVPAVQPASQSAPASPSTVKTVIEQPDSAGSGSASTDPYTFAANSANPAKPSGAIPPAAAPSAPTLTAAAATTSSPSASAPIAHPAQVAYNPSPSKTAAPATYAMQSPASIMVQIAAVSRQQDANVLISALRQHGFSASAHTEPADHFLHVQVGPFTTRAQAVAMRTKLLSDGYNAILK